MNEYTLIKDTQHAIFSIYIQYKKLSNKGKLPENVKKNGFIKGKEKCGKVCPACPFIKEGKSVKIKEWKVNKTYDCNS